ncbi:hypothetical protein CUC44_06660 [Aeromonas lusitana]|uniref:Uncharacterized protein n=1 Tax=Aeromonas lusitana TaxID=931529 RepID=A0A2M8HBN0_9GAMM|nr:hypothetical protein CUC44_06660 [Aeromonas lusitana]
MSGPRPREARVPTTPICEETGDIKETQCQNIVWTPPQGGSDPNYPNMLGYGSDRTAVRRGNALPTPRPSDPGDTSPSTEQRIPAFEPGSADPTSPLF